MSNRTVFKIFASFGPGGSVTALSEKVFKRVFTEAYELGDSEAFQSIEQQQIKKMRQEYVNELFDHKSTFESKSQSKSELVQLKAYTDLFRLIRKYSKKIVALEKQRINKEKIFYLKEENMHKYQKAQEKLETIEEEVIQNLKKMAVHVMDPVDHEKLEHGHSIAKDDSMNESTIEERVTLVKAEDMLESWKKMCMRAEIEYAGNKELIIQQENILKEQLFVEFGIDTEEIFEAFKFYDLNPNLNESDRKVYREIVLREIQDQQLEQQVK